MTKARDYCSKRELAALGILALLGVLTYSQPLILENTIDLRLFLKIPWVFWITLVYGLTIPFITRWLKKPKVIALWGTILYVLFWSFFTIADPQLRYPDSYVHSRSALLFQTYGLNTSVDSYLLWPLSFILQDITGNVAGLPLLEVSKFLAVALVASIGLSLMNFFSAFFKDPKNALLCLYITLIFPNTLMLTTQHYSPQLFAYFLSLLTITLLYKKRTMLFETNVVLIIVLLCTILSNPTTTAWIFPIIAAIWVLSYTVRKPTAFLLSSFVLLFYVIFTAVWWTQPVGMNVTADLLTPFGERLVEMLSAGKYSFSEGIFRPSYQPVYSLIIRRLTFAFIGILLILPLFYLFQRTYRLVARKAKFLRRSDAFFVALILGSLVGTLVFWIGSEGAFGDRTWAILVPVLAILCIKSVGIISNKNKTKIFGTLLIAIVLLLIPLNFVATNYSEALDQTSSAEATGIIFLSGMDLHGCNIFSDNFKTLSRFSYAILDPSNVIFAKSSHLLDPTIASNSSLLAEIRDYWSPHEQWSLYIHSEKTRLLMYARFGKDIGDWKDFNQPTGQINKLYDNGEIKIYQRNVNPSP